MSVTVVVDFEAKEGHENDLIAFLTNAVPNVRKTPGNQEANLYTDVENPRRPKLIEVWDSVELEMQHLGHLKEAGVLDKVGAMCTRAPFIFRLNKAT